jgi:hypothetical protein
MKLTDNERMVMNRFNSDDRYSFFDGGYVAEDSGTYASTFIPEMAAAMGKPESSARTVLTSMIKKGIFTSRDEEAESGVPIMEGDDIVGHVPGTERAADRWIELTDAGVELISDLRLEEDEAMLNMDEELEDDDEPEIQTKSIAALEADKRVKAYKEQTKGRQAAAKESIAQGKPSLRTSHADCTHATQGKEGKTARAKCRRDRAAAAKVAEEKALKKAERAAKKAEAHA